jgi:LPXTG-motif cell wall-anchored protein
MSTRYTRSVLAATVVTCAFAGWGSRAAIADNGKTPVTAIGCLQSEREYRRQHESSKFAGTGHGLGNEYMLINAVIGGPSLPVEPITEQEAATNCTTSGGSGMAFELKGHAEDTLTGMIGRRVVIHGMLLHADDDVVGTSGTYTPAPTGGGWFDPLGHDNKLREIDVQSFSLVPVKEPAKEETVIIGAQETVIEPPPAPAAAPPEAPAPAPPPPAAPAPKLPKTASQVPTIGLIGLLSLGCGVGLYLFNRRRARFA